VCMRMLTAHLGLLKCYIKNLDKRMNDSSTSSLIVVKPLPVRFFFRYFATQLDVHIYIQRWQREERRPVDGMVCRS